MNRKYSLLLVLITAIFELAFLVWTRADYRSTLLDGEEYEVPAAIEFQGDFYDRNYIAVNVPITETKWEGEREPETGETIYLVISKGQKGALILDHAQLTQPSGSYIKTRALRIMDGTVYFNFPADRMYMAPEQLKKLSVVELSERVQVPEDNGKTKTAIIPCSNTVFRRLIDIPTRKGTFMLSEELILHFLPKMFKSYEIREKALLRITRNADIDTETIYDEDLDYRDAMENLIKQRRRMNPVRMELSRELNKKMISSLCKELHVDKEHVFLTRVPLDMSFVFGLQGYLRNTAQDKLFYQRRTPRMTPELDDKSALIPQIMKKDVLLSYPFENIRSFINLLNEAAKDDSVVSIKMTLYRLADKSQIVDALVEAAENGKEVVVLVELRARFDEESNIEYSRKLEEAGCRVIYGLNGYKVHSKLCLISRKTDKGVSYITQIGTGNYNEKTSALYTDLSLITANQEIGKEAAEVFAALLKGEVVEKSNLLLVAPKCLQNRVLDMIQEEIDQVKQGNEGYIGIKINSLTDKVIINKLVEASQAGVKIEMVVRGICCLIPEIKGYTENIKVVSIVGRYLEHSRIYRFGTKEREKIYIASADFMTRNTVRRVEVAAPVLNEKLKERLDWMFETMMNDDEKGKRLTETGNYADRSLNDVKLNSQEIFYAMAYSNAEKTQKKRED